MMLAQLEAVNQLINGYGLAAIGLVSFVVIVSTLGISWRLVFKPALDTLLQISQAHERTTGNIDRSTERLVLLEAAHKKDSH